MKNILRKLSYQEIGIGTGQNFISEKNITDFLMLFSLISLRLSSQLLKVFIIIYSIIEKNLNFIPVELQVF
tara:strand:+ start:38 stop:250 length:213 start_codon:yes stop_codon:yes gene_type:complete